MSTVTDLNKYKARQAELTYKGKVTEILDYTKLVLRDDANNKQLHIHVMTTIITNLCTWVIKSKYFNSPRDVIRMAVNNALRNTGEPEL